MRRFLIGISFLVLLFFVTPVMAQSGSFRVTGFERQQDGLDQVFNLSVANDTGNDIVVNGRLIVLNVYDTSPPLSISIDHLVIQEGGTEKKALRWSNAPLFGEVRALLVLNIAPGKTIVENFEFWIFPWQAFLILVGALLLFSGVLLGSMKLLRKRKMQNRIEGPGPEKSSHLHEAVKKEKKKSKPEKKKKRKKYPSGMTGYVVEFGDTVVTVATRFGVTWEDVVRSNRLKPPYPLKPGKEILIPIHELRRPENPEDEEH